MPRRAVLCQRARGEVQRALNHTHPETGDPGKHVHVPRADPEAGGRVVALLGAGNRTVSLPDCGLPRRVIAARACPQRC